MRMTVLLAEIGGSVGHGYVPRRRLEHSATPARGFACWRNIAAPVHTPEILPQGRISVRVDLARIELAPRQCE